MQSDIILDVAQVAEHLRCEPDTAEDLMRRRELPATKVGRGWITTYGQVLGFVIRRIEAGHPRTRGFKASVATDSRSRRRLAEIPDFR